REVFAEELQALGDRHAAEAERIIEQVPREEQRGDDELERERDDDRRRRGELDDGEDREEREAHREAEEVHRDRALQVVPEFRLRVAPSAQRELLLFGDRFEREARE